MKKILLLTFISLSVFTNAQGTWTPKANFGGNVKQQAIGFSVGNYGYLGLGYEALGYVNDFWKYDPVVDTWTATANFPGGARWAGVGFSVGNYGYVSTGFRSSPNIFYSDLWRYDPSSNTWLQRANFPGGGRWGAIAFTIGNKGYVGLGYQSLTPTMYNDLWEYDPVANTWTAKANIPANRNFATGFSIGNKGYVVGGTVAFGNCNELWEFDPTGNTWTQKASYPGLPCDWMVSFTIGNYAYVGTGKVSGNAGVKKDFYRYDPSTNTWTPVTFFAGSARWLAVGFGIGSKGYLSTGNTDCPSPGCDTRDLWEFAPSTIGVEELGANEWALYPNPTNGIFHIVIDQPEKASVYNCMGELILTNELKPGDNELDLSQLSSGVYMVRIEQVIKKVIKE